MKNNKFTQYTKIHDDEKNTFITVEGVPNNESIFIRYNNTKFMAELNNILQHGVVYDINEYGRLICFELPENLFIKIKSYFGKI
jgi:hypothetical protein